MAEQRTLLKMEEIINGVRSSSDYASKHNLLVRNHYAFFLNKLEENYKDCLDYYKKSKSLDDMSHGFVDISEYKDRFKRDYIDERKDYEEYLGVLFEEWSVEMFDNLGLDDSYKSLVDVSDLEPVFLERRTEGFEIDNLKSDEEDKLIQILDDLHEKDIELFNKVEKKINNIYQCLKNNDILELSFAEQYANNMSGEDLLDFINKKNFDDAISGELKMTKSQEFQKVLFFKDDSVAYQDRHGDWGAPEFKAKTYSDFMSFVAEQYVDYTFRKKPKFKDVFLDKMKSEGYPMRKFDLSSQNLIQYENTLKAYDKDYINQLKNDSITLEGIDDYINKIIYKSNVKKFATSIISKKYSHLYNEDSYKYFKELYDLNISRSALEENIGSKMAGFKNSEEFNSALSRFYNSLNEFDRESYLMKMENIDADVIVDCDDMLILKINDYKASSVLGSGSWCISRSSMYFEDYTEDGNAQYFIYDFTKDSRDNDSMIGLTLTKEGDKKAMHYKNDDPVFEQSIVDKWSSTINDELKSQNKKTKKMKMG